MAAPAYSHCAANLLPVTSKNLWPAVEPNGLWSQTGRATQRVERRCPLRLDILAKFRLRLLPDTGTEDVTDAIPEISAWPGTEDQDVATPLPGT